MTDGPGPRCVTRRGSTAKAHPRSALALDDVVKFRFRGGDEEAAKGAASTAAAAEAGGLERPVVEVDYGGRIGNHGRAVCHIAGATISESNAEQQKLQGAVSHLRPKHRWS